VLMPEGPAERVNDVSLSTEMYGSITDYVGTLQPSDVASLLTGSLNTDVNDVANKFFGKFQFMLKTTQVDVTQKASISTPNLVPMMKRTMEYLQTSTDPEKYTKMISYYGTHVVTAASLGGACEMLLSIEACYASGAIFDNLQDYAQVYMSVQSQENPTGSNLVNNRFASYSSQLTLTMYGGDVTNENWLERQATISKAPVLISVDGLSPLSDYVTDPTTKSEFEAAIQTYIDGVWSRQNAAAAAALAAQTFAITATMTLDFSGFEASFGFQQGYEHCWHIFGWKFHCRHECRGESACYYPGGDTTNCKGPQTGTLLFGSQVSLSLKRGQSTQVSPDGSTSCNAPTRSIVGIPQFPLGKYEQLFTCSVLADGSVQATDVSNPDWDAEPHLTGSVTYQDGSPTFNGCSIAKAIYTDASWKESGGQGGCSSETTLHAAGTFTANGYCCVGVTPTLNGECIGDLVYASCPQPQ
jgi:hypothetical protein